jgi:putative ABC transport system substrate-binding protein
MNRREMIAALGGAAASWPIAARAQRPAVPVIGLLSGTDREASPLGAILQGLNETGFVEGRSLVIARRFYRPRHPSLNPQAPMTTRRRCSAHGTGAEPVSNALGRVARTGPPHKQPCRQPA